jgi:DeoR family glycerol-3-phosphate regulon repressor
MINPRQKQILELTERRGYVSIDALAALFDMTPQTVRRDVNNLCDQGLLLRQHGGASLPLMNSSYSQRNVEFVAEKTKIADSVVSYLPDRASIFLPLGTTVEAVARALAKTDKQLTIVTNSVEVARIFWTDTSFETVVTGGILQQRNGGLIGQRAIDVCMDHRCDYAITGIGAIERDGTLLDFYEAEIAVMKAMHASARHHFVVADHTKFDRFAKRRLGHLSEIDCLFTDSAVPEPFIETTRKAGCEIVVAAAEANAAPLRHGYG